jgi:hypothetical protein
MTPAERLNYARQWDQQKMPVWKRSARMMTPLAEIGNYEDLVLALRDRADSLEI